MAAADRRGNEAPMDFEMLAALSPSTNTPWLLAAHRFAAQKPPAAQRFPRFESVPQLAQAPPKQPEPNLRRLAKPDPEQLPRKRKKTGQPRTHRPPPDAFEYAGDLRRQSTHTWMYLPYLVTGYIQMLFSLFLFATVVYIVYQFVASVRHDLQLKADEYSLEISHQIAECAKAYYANKCSPVDRVPAMEKLCREWELCMVRDPKEVGRLKVGAETLAEILNKLIEPLSYKTMIFGTLALLASLFVANSALQFAKSQHVPIGASVHGAGTAFGGAGAANTAAEAVAAAAAAAVAAARRTWNPNGGMNERRRIRMPRQTSISLRQASISSNSSSDCD